MSTTSIDINRRRGRQALRHAANLARNGPNTPATEGIVASYVAEWLEANRTYFGADIVDPTVRQLDAITTASASHSTRHTTFATDAADLIARRAAVRGGVRRGMERRPAGDERRGSQPNFVDNPAAVDEDGNPIELSDDPAERSKQLREVRGRMSGRMEYR